MPDKKENQQIQVNTMNWGPCVVHLKVLDNFKNILLDEIKKSKDDYRHKLAGQIEKDELQVSKNATR